MAYPIKYIENNLVFNHDGECFAYYELLPYNYSFLSPEQKYLSLIHISQRRIKMAKKKKSSAFAVVQQIGKSFFLPVSVLPIAGILLGLGSSFTLSLIHIYLEQSEQQETLSKVEQQELSIQILIRQKILLKKQELIH